MVGLVLGGERDSVKGKLVRLGERGRKGFKVRRGRGKG